MYLVEISVNSYIRTRQTNNEAGEKSYQQHFAVL